MTFGERLKAARNNKGYTQEHLASLVGIAKSTLTGYERGNREPNVLTIRALAEALDVTGDNLLGTNKIAPTIAQGNEEVELLNIYRSLDDSRRSSLLVIAQDMSVAQTAVKNAQNVG